MIVWLASYPRSGNTLLRTILYKTMGLESTSDEVGEIGMSGLAAARSNIGAVEFEGDWADYYRSAMNSDDVFLVKTHRPPRDDQPAIYVVRDGRQALVSYAKFHQRFTSEPFPSLLDLVIGGDFYGDWSDHYRIWSNRPNTFVVRYEDLVLCESKGLADIAKVVRHSGSVAAWKNPFDKLNQLNPDFFRVGSVVWEGDSAWSQMINAVFLHLHGDLMVELGYTTHVAVIEATRCVPKELLDLVDASRQFLKRQRNLEEICNQRQAIIDDLKLVCDERLELIKKLTRR